MAEETKISWTQTGGRPGATFNPWMGCLRVSPGCEHCYAETFVTGRMGLPVWGPPSTTERKRTSDANWKKPLAWNRQAEREGRRIKVFCSSLADVFENNPQVAAWRADLFRIIERTPHLDWLLLTKRPQHMRRLAQEAGWAGEWPSNVWAGCTVESQAMADERIPHLLQVPARVRFLSCEPLLEPVELFRDEEGALRGPAVVVSGGVTASTPDYPPEGYDDSHPGIDWVIVGGESGHHARPFDLAWARSLRDQCKEAGTAFFMKQVGASPVGCPRAKDKAGADPDEWPEDLRVQEFPT